MYEAIITEPFSILLGNYLGGGQIFVKWGMEFFVKLHIAVLISHCHIRENGKILLNALFLYLLLW
jgi:hypothetical protein